MGSLFRAQKTNNFGNFMKHVLMQEDKDSKKLQSMI